ncbi:MAG TPA: glycosyl hydrolase family 28-related protein [Chitinophagaceae bacterium]
MFKFFIIIIFSIIFSEIAFSQTFLHSSWYNIKNYGAAGDGKTVDTKFINDAIDEAAKAGGGTILFPAGTYLSYSIHLKSNISLYFDQGCILLAADSSAGGKYDTPEPNAFDKYQDYDHSHWQNSLIWEKI